MRDAWSAVDELLNAQVMPDDPALTAALADSAAAGLPAIAVAPNQAKLLHILARLSGARPRARGKILEIGVGTGLNLPLYPREVDLVGIDISPDMLAHARRRAAELGRAADLREGDAEALPFPDASFDTVVSTLSLCTVPDHRKAVAEAWRVLRPGARFVLLEHVRSPQLVVRAIERALDPFATWLACDHLVREPLEALHDQGFEIAELVRSKIGLVERVVAVRR